jgi:hypothetical protein
VQHSDCYDLANIGKIIGLCLEILNLVPLLGGKAINYLAGFEVVMNLLFVFVKCMI